MNKEFVQSNCRSCIHGIIGSSPGFVAELCTYDYCHGVQGATAAGRPISKLTNCPKLEAQAKKVAA